MNAIINFMREQAPMIESGRIPHAIRPCRSDARDPEPGDTLYLYAGLNTAASRLLRTEVCEYVAAVTILPSFGIMHQVLLGRDMLDVDQVESLARANGFEDGAAMVQYFAVLYGLPFSGNLIGWSQPPDYVQPRH